MTTIYTLQIDLCLRLTFNLIIDDKDFSLDIYNNFQLI